MKCKIPNCGAELKPPSETRAEADYRYEELKGWCTYHDWPTLMVGIGQHIDPFNRLIMALAPWLEQVVIIGGWGHKLYRLHPPAQQVNYPPSGTLDTDVLLPDNLPVDEPNIRERRWAMRILDSLRGS